MNSALHGNTAVLRVLVLLGTRSLTAVLMVLAGHVDCRAHVFFVCGVVSDPAQLAVKDMLNLLENSQKWDEAREALKSPPLAPREFKACFRTYSDADPEQHLAFDLYRIQAQDALKVTQTFSRGFNKPVVSLTWLEYIVLRSIDSAMAFGARH